jgi:hypothetical protein
MDNKKHINRIEGDPPKSSAVDAFKTTTKDFVAEVKKTPETMYKIVSPIFPGANKYSGGKPKSRKTKSKKTTQKRRKHHRKTNKK